MDQRTGGVYPGWVVVGGVFFTLTVSSGLGFYGLAVYLDAITDEQGFSTGSVSLATTVFFVVGGIAGRLAATLIDRCDIRYVIAGGAVIAAIALGLLGQVDELWQLYLTYVLFAVGWAMSGLVPSTTLVTRWFHRRRSLALSIASTGLSVGGLTFTRIASWRIDTDGLESSAGLLAGLYLLIVPVALLTMWPDPASRNTWPDGVPPPVGADPTEAVEPEGTPYDDATRSTFFLVVTGAFILLMAAQVGGIAQMAKLGTERIDRAAGANALAAIAITSVLARLVLGTIADRVRLIPLTASLAVGQAIALALLSQADSAVALIASACLFGATVGNLLMLQPLLIADRFGVRDYPRIFSFNQLLVTLGVAGGPFLLGALHDAVDYELSYVTAASLSVLGAGILLLARSPQPSVAAATA